MDSAGWVAQGTKNLLVCLSFCSIGANIGFSSETENLKSRNMNVITAKAN